MAPVDFNGKWTETRRDGYNDIFKLLGFPEEMQKTMSEFKLTQDVTQDGDKMRIVAPLPNGKEQVVDLVMDGTEQTFDHVMSGSKATVCPRWDGNKFVAELSVAGKKGCTERYIENDELVMCVKFGDVAGKVYFSKC